MSAAANYAGDLFKPGLNSTPRDRVKAAHPGAVAERKLSGLWRVFADGPEVYPRLALGQGRNAARAWDDAAARLRRRPPLV